MAIELTLQPSKTMPRALLFQLTASGKTLSVRVMTAESRQTISYTIGSFPEDWSLRVKDRALWCRGTALSLSEDDVSKIRKTYAPHGLVIEAESATAAPLGPESAKVVASAVPPHGKRETSRPSDCSARTDGRALDSEAAILEYALTNGECY